jgi:hypothetical protein
VTGASNIAQLHVVDLTDDSLPVRFEAAIQFSHEWQFWPSFVYSPNGKWLTYFAREATPSLVTLDLSRPVPAAALTVNLDSFSTTYTRTLDWAPDSRHFVFGVKTSDSSNDWSYSIVRVPPLPTSQLDFDRGRDLKWLAPSILGLVRGSTAPTPVPLAEPGLRVLYSQELRPLYLRNGANERVAFGADCSYSLVQSYANDVFEDLIPRQTSARTLVVSPTLDTFAEFSNNQVMLWSIADQTQPLATFSALGGFLGSPACWDSFWSDSGNAFVWASENLLNVVRLSGGSLASAPLPLLAIAGASDVVFSPDDHWLAGSDTKGNLWVVDLRQEPLTPINLSPNSGPEREEAIEPGFSPDSRYLARGADFVDLTVSPLQLRRLDSAELYGRIGHATTGEGDFTFVFVHGPRPSLWSRDSRYFAYMSSEGLWVVDVTDANPAPVRVGSAGWFWQFSP